MSYGFCSKFHTLSSSAKIFENRLRFDKVTESLKVVTFLRHSVLCMQWRDDGEASPNIFPKVGTDVLKTANS